jgi:hypothetical protein
MSLDYTSLQAWILSRAVRPELTTEVVNFIREAEAMIRRKVEAFELRSTLLEADRSSAGLYNLSGQVREVRAVFATDNAGESYPLERVGLAGIRQLRSDADVKHYCVEGQTIEFRGVPGTDAELELHTIGWPDPLATTSTNSLLTYHEDIYTFGALYFLRDYEEDLELAQAALDKFTRAAEDFNKLVRARSGGGSVLPWYNFGQFQIGRGR